MGKNKTSLINATSFDDLDNPIKIIVTADGITQELIKSAKDAWIENYNEEIPSQINIQKYFEENNDTEYWAFEFAENDNDNMTTWDTDEQSIIKIYTNCADYDVDTWDENWTNELARY